MSCSKCGPARGAKLCPISLGLAFGVTCALMTILWTFWFLNWGLPTSLAPYSAMIMQPADWSTGLMVSLWALLKGFIFGFLVALIYDLCVCCCKCKCCHKCKCDANCQCNVPTNKPGM